MDIRKKLDIKEYDELEEGNSIGLSDRMLRALSRDVDGFVFDKRLRTEFGSRVKISGFAERPERYIFVEARCKELYTKKRYTTLGREYSVLYGYINDSMGGSLICDIQEHPSKDGYMRVRFFVDGEEIRYFDIGKMITNFIGIATSLLRGELLPEQIDFLYLLYDPTELECEEEIKDVYMQICAEAIGVDMNLLFVSVLRYLRDAGVGELADDDLEQYFYRLTFTLCNQDFYTDLL